MSKLTLDQILKRVKESRDTTIFTISTDGLFEALTEGTGGMMGGMRDLTYLQADNQMKTFSDLTGGMHFEPRFIGELPDDVKAINENIRVKVRTGVPPHERQAGRDVAQDPRGACGR